MLLYRTLGGEYIKHTANKQLCRGQALLTIDDRAQRDPPGR